MMDMRELALRHWRALSLDLRLEDRPIPLPITLALYVTHFLGLLAIIRLTHQSFWLLLIPALLFQPFVVSVRLGRVHLLPESLAPLIFAYGVLFLRILVAILARLQGLTSGPLTVPEPWGLWLNLNVVIALSGLWVLLAQAGPMAEAFGRRVDWKILLGCTLAVLTLAWATISYLSVRTQGVTGSDPYAYVQMAVDIARHSTPLHTFPLAPQVAEWGLPMWPVVHTGYLPPDVRTGTSATVWAPGHSALLALGYRLGGETWLYTLTPLLGLLTLVALWGLSLEVLRPWPNGWRYLAAGIAVFVLATSYEQIDRLAVPMADVPAQLFSILTIYFALRATRGKFVLFAGLTGLCLGLAFAVRYTQVLLGFCVLAAWIPFLSQSRERSWRTLVPAVGGFVVVALLVATPVLWYHTIAFGGPFRVGWAELELFGSGNIPTTLAHTVRALLDTKEFFFLAPFLVWGMIHLWSISRRAGIVLLVWLLVIVLFHLNYAPLRIRDLLSVFPVFAIWVGVGMADVLYQIQRIARPFWRTGFQVLALVLMFVLLLTRGWVTLPLPVHAADFTTFGYLRIDQRAAFDELANLTPPDAIVATTLNSGPIELYADRDAVRPAYWARDEWLDFIDRALGEGRHLYLLVDGDEMQTPLQIVQSRYHLVQVSSLPVPYFFPGGNSEDRSVPLYQVVP
jgi:hypothetical protein